MQLVRTSGDDADEDPPDVAGVDERDRSEPVGGTILTS